jgi:hypothetical protein
MERLRELLGREVTMLFRQAHKEPPAMTLEGILGPNSRIDDAQGAAVPEPKSVCLAADGSLLLSSGNRVLSLARWGDEPQAWAEFGGPVSALACGPGGAVAVGLEGGGLAVLDPAGKPTGGWNSPVEAGSIADLAFLSGDEIAVVDHGYSDDHAVMSVAPWDYASRGRILVAGKSGGSRVLASGLHCPMGACLDASGRLLVTLFERASVVEAEGTVRRTRFPGYVGRLRKIDGGYAMACLSRRDPLIEFLKTERGFVDEMKARIAPRHWIAPRQDPEFRHDFPIELGAGRLFGEVKPWAPSFSYGLVIELDEQLMPVASAHSRANGRRHAISDVCQWNGDLIAVSRASGEILNLGSAAR